MVINKEDKKEKNKGRKRWTYTAISCKIILEVR